LVGIFTNLKRCHLQSNNLDKLIFVSKNWPNDLRVSCSSHTSLIMLVEFDGLRGIIRGVWRGIWKKWNFVFVFLSRWIIWLKLLYHVIQKAWIFNRYYVVGYSNIEIWHKLFIKNWYDYRIC
jgi:DNA modification methylase